MARPQEYLVISRNGKSLRSFDKKGNLVDNTVRGFGKSTQQQPPRSFRNYLGGRPFQAHDYSEQLMQRQRMTDIQHSNKANKDGRRVRTQTVLAKIIEIGSKAMGTFQRIFMPQKTIKHYTGGSIL